MTTHTETTPPPLSPPPSLSSPHGQGGPDDADAWAERILGSALGAIETLTVHLGDRLGWYDALADGPLTAAELARATGTDERYAREWLEQQAVIGFLTTEAEPEPDPGADSGSGSGSGAPAHERRYALPAALGEVLTDAGSLAFLAPLARMVVAAARRTPELLEAYRTGGGVSWEEYGEDARVSQSDMNRPWFEHRLGDALATVPAVHALLSGSEARLAEVGSGGGWAAIALAKAYPHARVDGFDIDAPSVEMARVHAEAAGVADRVHFHLVDGSDLPEQSAFDAVFAFECVHDMARPVEVLAAVRRAVRPEGVVVVMDEAVGERFSAPGDDLERLMYGFSTLICLPDGRSHTPSAATGTVMRPAVLEGYAQEAGFEGIEILPIEDFSFFRFYRLR